MTLGRLAQLARNAFLGRNAEQVSGNLSMTAHQLRRIVTTTEKLKRSGVKADRAHRIALGTEQIRSGKVTITPTRRIKIEAHREL